MVFYFFRLESFSQCYIIDIVSQLKEKQSINFVSTYHETIIMTRWILISRAQSNVVDILCHLPRELLIFELAENDFALLILE